MRRPPGGIVAELAALALVLGGVGLLSARDLASPSAEFDEGVYLASAEALGRGAQLGTEVFASQPPLFFAGLRALAMAGDATLARAAFVAIALGGALAAALVVRPLAGRAGGVIAALLVGLAPAVADRAAVVSADIPALALGLAAMAAARRPRWALAAGALVAAAVLVKLLALPFAGAVVAGAAARRASRREWALGALGAAAVLAIVLLPFAGRWASLWHGAVGIRGAARAVSLEPGAPPGGYMLGIGALALAAVAGVLAVRAGRRGPWVRERADLFALLALAVALMAVQRPLFLHHWALLSIPLAVLAASAWPARPRRGAVVAGLAVVLLLLPGAVHGRELLEPPARERVARVAAVVRALTPPGTAVVSDLPLVPLAAGRPAVADTIDASYVRVGAGALGRDAIVRAGRGASAVVVGRAFADVPGLETALAARFPHAVGVGDVTVFLEAAGRPTR